MRKIRLPDKSGKKIHLNRTSHAKIPITLFSLNCQNAILFRPEQGFSRQVKEQWKVIDTFRARERHDLVYASKVIGDKWMNFTINKSHLSKAVHNKINDISGYFLTSSSYKVTGTFFLLINSSKLN